MAETKVGVTEIVTLRVKEGLKPTDFEGYDNLFGIKGHGYMGGRYGWRNEDKGIFHWILYWDCLESHQDLMALPEYGPFVDKILEFSAPPSLFHAALAPHPPKEVFAAPVTEVALLPINPETTKEEWLVEYRQFEELLVKAPGYKGHATGWQTEDDRCYVFAIGWETVEAHTEWAKSKDGSTAIEIILKKTMKDKVDMWHLHNSGELTMR